MSVHEMPFDVRVRWDDHAVALTAPEVDRRVRAALEKAFDDDAWLDIDALVVLPRPKLVTHEPGCPCGHHDEVIGGE